MCGFSKQQQRIKCPIGSNSKKLFEMAHSNPRGLGDFEAELLSQRWKINFFNLKNLWKFNIFKAVEVAFTLYTH